jgi:hypothetical protein
VVNSATGVFSIFASMGFLLTVAALSIMSFAMQQSIVWTSLPLR